ncbi:hypothetical protein ACSMXN_12680 [Jatrophihabitans sp. DSM 45814]
MRLTPNSSVSTRSRRFDLLHPSVRAAAQRAGLDVDTYVYLREAETHWVGNEDTNIRRPRGT